MLGFVAADAVKDSVNTKRRANRFFMERITSNAVDQFIASVMRKQIRCKESAPSTGRQFVACEFAANELT